MITIYEKMWFAVNKSRANSLAYITYYEDNKAFEKRKQTGLSWSQEKDGVIFDNTPTKGFQVLGVTTRYSTDNKMHLMFKCVFNPELVGGLYIVMEQLGYNK